MIHKGLLLLISLLMVNCMSQKSDKKTDDVVVNSARIKQVINNNRFSILQNAEMIIAFNVSKELIEGTTDEYYNKLIIIDTISGEASVMLKTILQNDETYNWESNIDSAIFDPQQQFLFKFKDAQLTVLLDSKNKVLAFTDLYGQEIIGVKHKIIF